MTDEPTVARSRVLSPSQFAMFMATSPELKAHPNSAYHPAVMRSAYEQGGHKREGGSIARTAAAGINWAAATRYHTMS